MEHGLAGNGIHLPSGYNDTAAFYYSTILYLATPRPSTAWFRFACGTHSLSVMWCTATEPNATQCNVKLWRGTGMVWCGMIWIDVVWNSYPCRQFYSHQCTIEQFSLSLTHSFSRYIIAYLVPFSLSLMEPQVIKDGNGKSSTCRGFSH